jgi:hypothetical protein
VATSSASPRPVKRWRSVVFRIVATLTVLVPLAGIYPMFAPFGVATEAATASYHAMIHTWHVGVLGVLFAVLLGGPVVGLAWSRTQRPLLAQFVILSGLIVVVLPLALGIVLNLVLVLGLLLVVLLSLAYPTPRDLLRWPREGVRIPLLVLGLVALLALAPDIWGNVRLQLTDAGSEHALNGHWATAAVTDVVLAIAALLSALKRPGWKVLGISTGLTLLYLGAAALAGPHVPGSWGTTGGVLALIGALAYLVVSLVEGPMTQQNQLFLPAQRAKEQV